MRMTGGYPKRLLVLLLLLWWATAGAQTAPDIARGTTRQEVIQLYGWPKGKSTSDDREIWAYDAFDVSFQNGRVLFVTPRRASASTAPTPRALQPRNLSSPSSTPMPSRTLPAVTTTPSPARPLEPYRPLLKARTVPPTTPPATNDFWYWTRLFAPFGIAACILGIAAVMKAERRRVEREATARRSVMPNPPKKTWQESVAEQLRKANGPVPPPVIIPSASPMELTYELLLKLEWKRVELLTCLYFRATGVRADCTGIGADGGVDVQLFRGTEAKPYSLVQCKAWADDVGVALIRELRGVMASAGVAEGVFVTTSRYTDEARRFAAANSVTLIDGRDLLDRVNRLPPHQRGSLLAEVTHGDYTTPTCPNCDIKLVLRSGEAAFWGCRNYPRCHTKIYRRKSAAA